MGDRLADSPFVGRDQELATILGAVDRAEHGESSLLLIGGEAGIGKTRLIEEAGRRLTGRGIFFAVGACVEYGVHGVPLAPLGQLLRGLLDDPRTAGLVDAPSGEPLAGLLPDADTRRAPEQAFHPILGLVEKVSRIAAVVLIFEDVHDADSATAALLTFLARSLRAGVVLIATYRTDLYRLRPQLAGLLATLERQRTAERVELKPFRLPEVAAQVRALLGDEVAQGDMQQIYGRGQGNPYFTEMLARDLGRSGQTLPSSLREMLISRVYRLPEPTRVVLRTLAAGGMEVSHGLLIKVSGLSNQQLSDALRPAVTEGIIILTAEHTGYRFHHALTHEAVEQDLMPGDLVVLHRTYAEALEESGVGALDENASEIARHWHAAHNVKNAFPALVRAAEVAASRFAFAEELRMLELALELWSMVDLTVRPAQEQLLYRAAVAAGKAGQDGRALRLTDAGLTKLAHDDADLGLKARFLIERAKSAKVIGQGDGTEDLRAAIIILLAIGQVEEAVSAYVILAAALFSTSRYSEALVVVNEGIELARRADRKIDEIHMRNVLGWCMAVAANDPDRGFVMLRQARREAVELGDIALSGRSAINLSTALNTVGRHAEALEVAQDALLSLRLGLPRAYEALLYINTVEALVPLGRWDQAVTILNDAIESDCPGVYAAGIWGLLADIALWRGQYDDAATFVDRGWQTGGRTTAEAQFIVPLARTEAELARVNGRIGDVRLALQRIAQLSCADITALDEYVWPLIMTVAQAEADHAETQRAQGSEPDPESAESIVYIRELAPRQATPYPYSAVCAAIAEAEYARWEGADTDAKWETALTVAHSSYTPPHHVAYILWRCAQSAHKTKAPDRAAELMSRAHSVAHHTGMRPLLEALDTLAHDTDDPAAEPASPPMRSLLTPLTQRETEVLRLMAEGLTNGQIGTKLHIATKTASTHVSNILVKLGAATRTEAAAAAHRLDLLA
ncbi:helix-turn-helix transcriptional regulator [Actinospica sp.]|uniref:helix-turn-helix transcriptional regulator n=1 Tax=Actinospica sp. TaxID=1872142 RepID=UPI002C0C3CC2|nr:AAA family ATPase [Actinospica sp.]HWG26403.1 AAA family ATPase [Actinospica sp.]